MKNGFSFDKFMLDVENRLLTADGVPVELSGRYLDALALMVREAGALITKDRFMDEVWRGVPVTDEALTQCVKTLRRALGDDAARPRFIETVPKYGYRFVGVVSAGVNHDDTGSIQNRHASGAEGDRRSTWHLGQQRTNALDPSLRWGDEIDLEQSDAERSSPTPPPLRGSSAVASQRLRLPLKGRGVAFLQLTGAGVVGGGLAGVLGGIVYGFAGAGQAAGGASLVLVLTALCVAVALVGAAGVSLGIAAALVLGRGWAAYAGGGALGGLVTGGVVKLLGLDAFNLLLGQSPENITGALEGAGLGGAVGLGVWLCGRSAALRRGVLWAALCGGLAGAGIAALGGRMMAGSLDLLAQVLPQSRLRLDGLGALFGEDGLGPVAQVATGALEGALFAGFIAGAMLLARRQIEVLPPQLD